MDGYLRPRHWRLLLNASLARIAPNGSKKPPLRTAEKAGSLSLHLRLLIVASLVTCAFVGLTGWALDRAFRESAQAAVREQLRIHIYSLLAVADISGEKGLVFPNELPEARFSTPSSGLYAMVKKATDQTVWRSQSMVGMSFSLPPAPVPGSSSFDSIRDKDGSDYFIMGFSVSWESSPGKPQAYTFYVAESTAEYNVLVGRFRRELWINLGAGSFFLLLAQAAVLRWSLRPLRRVAQEIREVEAGTRSQLTEHYPMELNRLTRRLNALIRQRSEHLERYRKALDDLAHSLKTPLAVVRGVVGGDELHTEAKGLLTEQVGILDKAIEYQLQRAAASGRSVLRQAAHVQDIAQKLARSLRKVYAAKAFELEVEIAEGLEFPGDERDLTELIGNLLDNACKWARSRVRLRAHVVTSDQGSSLRIIVEDDGPGFPHSQQDDLSNRGYRADQTIAGYGIGLAVVRELVVDVYGAELKLDRSEALGGAAVILKFPL